MSKSKDPKRLVRKGEGRAIVNERAIYEVKKYSECDNYVFNSGRYQILVLQMIFAVLSTICNFLSLEVSLFL